MTEDEEPSEDVHELISDIEDRFSASRDVLKGRIETVEETLEEMGDDAREKRAELRATVDGLQDEVAKLQFELEQLRGLGENEGSSPAARVRDLRSTMIRRARSLESRDGIQLWWKEVQSLLADLGHGEVKKPECYKAMKDAAEADAFEMAKKVNENGNQVKAIRLKSAALPAAGASSDPTTGQGVSAGQNGGETAAAHNQD